MATKKRPTKNGRPRVPTLDLRVSDVLGAPALTKSHEVRTVGPALVFVIEKDAPVRMELIADTHAEALAVGDLVRSDAVAAEFMDVYRWGQLGDFTREDAHAARLEAGQTIESLRVPEDASTAARSGNRRNP